MVETLLIIFVCVVLLVRVHTKLAKECFTRLRELQDLRETYDGVLPWTN